MGVSPAAAAAAPIAGATSRQIEHVGDENSTTRAGAWAADQDAVAVVIDPRHRRRRLAERRPLRVDLERAARTQAQMERADLSGERHDDGGEDQHQEPLRDERRGPPPGHRIVQVGAFCSSMNWMNGLPSPASPTTARSSPS